MPSRRELIRMSDDELQTFLRGTGTWYVHLTDATSDVWGVGATLFTMLTGRKVFEQFKHQDQLVEHFKELIETRSAKPTILKIRAMLWAVKRARRCWRRRIG